jgi:hypothetical protein
MKRVRLMSRRADDFSLMNSRKASKVQRVSNVYLFIEKGAVLTPTGEACQQTAAM